MTYRCTSCSHEFKEPLHLVDRERIDYGIGVQWVTLFEGDVCPECECTRYEDVPDLEEAEDDAA